MEGYTLEVRNGAGRGWGQDNGGLFWAFWRVTGKGPGREGGRGMGMITSMEGYTLEVREGKQAEVGGRKMGVSLTLFWRVACWSLGRGQAGKGGIGVSPAGRATPCS
jgi:hypothetical protein